MKIKTLEASSAEEIDKLVNDFEEDNNVKATQTHVDRDNSKYSYVLFYVPEGKQPTVKHTVVKG